MKLTKLEVFQLIKSRVENYLFKKKTDAVFLLEEELKPSTLELIDSIDKHNRDIYGDLFDDDLDTPEELSDDYHLEFYIKPDEDSDYELVYMSNDLIQGTIDIATVRDYFLELIRTKKVLGYIKENR